MTSWLPFPYNDADYHYSEAQLKKNWSRLHRGDAEPLPKAKNLLTAWQAFHAGQFERATQLGLAHPEPAGYAVANKAQAIYATYLEKNEKQKLRLFEQVAERALEHQTAEPNAANAWYWYAYALGRYAQGLSIAKALQAGIGGKIKHSLEQVLKLEPKHADAHLALGTYHAEIIDKIGTVVGSLTYGANKKEGLEHFQKALQLNPAVAIARIEYANGLVMLEGKKALRSAEELYAEAAQCTPMDAMEKFDVELARYELQDS
jgi:tetratricopeptide (TPR) repeat protein